jgi:hypothetical protein
MPADREVRLVPFCSGEFFLCVLARRRSAGFVCNLSLCCALLEELAREFVLFLAGLRCLDGTARIELVSCCDRPEVQVADKRCAFGLHHLGDSWRSKVSSLAAVTGFKHVYAFDTPTVKIQVLFESLLCIHSFVENTCLWSDVPVLFLCDVTPQLSQIRLLKLQIRIQMIPMSHSGIQNPRRFSPTLCCEVFTLDGHEDPRDCHTCQRPKCRTRYVHMGRSINHS